MRYLVTGGEGYVGRHLVRALVSKGANVVVCSRRGTPAIKGARVVHLDILNPDGDVYDLTGRPDVLIHLAWEDGFKHESSKHLDNVQRHADFLRRMLRGGLRHVASLGTMHEIGYYVGPVMETTPAFPQHPYGIAKNHLRLVQGHIAKEFGATEQWLRCYYIYGDDELNNSIFTKILAAEAEGRTEFPLNSGELLYDFIEVRRLGELIASVASQDKVNGIINCATGDPISLRTMVLRFIEERGLRIKPHWGQFPLRQYDSRAIWGDVAKLNEALAAASLQF